MALTRDAPRLVVVSRVRQVYSLRDQARVVPAGQRHRSWCLRCQASRYDRRLLARRCRHRAVDDGARGARRMVQVLGNQRSFNVALLKFCCRPSRRACRKRGESSNFWSATPWRVAPLTRIATNSASEASSSIWIFSGPQASPNDEKTHQAPLLG
jgi:hypothetical protein